MAAPRPRFAILASGRGSNADCLMAAFATDLTDAELVLVASDHADAPVLEKASRRAVPTAVVERGDLTRESHEDALLETLGEAGAEHLLLAGYMRILSPRFLEQFGGTILNIHPSLLPDFPGLEAPARQWESGVAVAGATVHFVDEGVDSGPILLQGSIPVRGDEGPDGLADRIRTEVEHRIYPEALRLLIDRLRQQPTVTRALLSVSDKTGIADLARRLAALDIALIASGGTAAALAEAGIGITRVEETTGAREVLGGRVKTLHPAIHAGILADRRSPAHMTELAESGYAPIDLVVCNLYPFERTLASGAARHTIVENIDIGGPTLVRAAAKNADGGVTVVVDPGDYPEVAAALEAGGAVPLALRRRLAAKAFDLVAGYDAAIAAWASGRPPQALRYGENPHQPAHLERDATGRGVAAGRLLQGKELSYNNLLDLDAAYRAAYGPGLHRCALVKHTNPCGLAEAVTQAEAFRRALSGDPVAAFGGVLGFSAVLEEATAAAIIESGLFVECIAAPGFDPPSRQLLGSRRNLRLLAVPAGDPSPERMVHTVGGGRLVQDPDPGPDDPATWRVVTRLPLADDRGEEARFAMHAVALLKSNAVCVTSDRTLRGAGAGVMSRIDACRLALEKAAGAARGAILASDGFFPFDDCVRLAAAAGVAVVVQPGGSRRDQEVIDACDELGLVMLFTGRRHFRH